MDSKQSQIRKGESRQKKGGKKVAISKGIERSWERRACHQLQHLHPHQHCCCCSWSDVEELEADTFELMTVRVYRSIMPTGCLETWPIQSQWGKSWTGTELLLNSSSDQCCFWLCMLFKALYLIWTVCFIIVSHVIERCSDAVFFFGQPWR